MLDDAATLPGDESLSTNGAVDNAGSCHSVRAMIDNHNGVVGDGTGDRGRHLDIDIADIEILDVA